jgi:hypothetical protein
MELFTSITCSRARNTVFRFNQLLSGSPHIGLYVKHFSLIGVSDDFLQDCISAALILPLLPNLESLAATPPTLQHWDNQPAPFSTALEGATSLRSLRRLSLSKYCFPDAPMPDSLLCHATGLKELELCEITFADSSIRRVGPAHREALVVLESLKVDFMSDPDTAAIVAAFDMVDVRHLRSLEVARVRVATPIFKANAQTIQKVRFFFPDGASDYYTCPFLHILNSWTRTV